MRSNIESVKRCWYYGDMIKSVIFIIVSALIIILSWKSLRNPHSHGFFHFFAFECSLVLLLLNVQYWFEKPFSIIHIISWVLLLLSLVMVAEGFYLLSREGKPTGKIEDATVLVQRGIYKFIRHPLDSSLLLFSWGVFFKNPSLLPGCLVIVTSVFLVATARVEEAENIQKFGDDYATYLKETRMFIPFVF